MRRAPMTGSSEIGTWRPVIDDRARGAARRAADRRASTTESSATSFVGWSRAAFRVQGNAGAIATAGEILGHNPDGVFLANGPADPAALPYAREAVRDVLGASRSSASVLGHQIFGLALGGKTYKLTLAIMARIIRSRISAPSKVEITSQNHGFAVDADSCAARAELSHVNLNDNTVEGLRGVGVPFFSVQYHPEASPGPHDAGYLFARFRRAWSKLSAMARGSDRIGRPPLTVTPATAPKQARSTGDSDVLNVPLRKDLKSVLLIGSGPIVIGQACEFDYSGTQALKALREEGLRLILVNSNPATIMTDPELADRTYIEPMTVAAVTADHRARAARRVAADGRRSDRAQPGDRACAKRACSNVTASS